MTPTAQTYLASEATRVAREMIGLVSEDTGITSITMSAGGESATIDRAAAKTIAAIDAAGAAQRKFKVPKGIDFIRGDFLPSEELEELAEELIDRYEYLQAPTEGLSIRYVWKREGGSTAGQPVLGKCVKPSGLAKYYSSSDFVIWIAADHTRFLEFNAEQIEAVLFHQLNHIGALVKDGRVTHYVRPHDFEGFKAEIHEYGFWLPEIKEIANVFQLRLEDAIGAEAAQS